MPARWACWSIDMTKESVTDKTRATPSLLNGMGGRIQGENLISLLTTTLITLEKDYSELRSLLDQKLWQAASAKAHQLKGSAYLFGGEDILFFLDRIVEGNTGLIGTETFKNNFWGRSQGCLEKLQQALDKEGK